MICLLFRNSAVAYTVALGLFLAVGRETTGKIPPGKVCTYSLSCGGSRIVMWWRVGMEMGPTRANYGKGSEGYLGASLLQ